MREEVLEGGRKIVKYEDDGRKHSTMVIDERGKKHITMHCDPHITLKKGPVTVQCGECEAHHEFTQDGSTMGWLPPFPGQKSWLCPECAKKKGPVTIQAGPQGPPAYSPERRATDRRVGQRRAITGVPVTYLVTGFMRSGTSMMMRALYEGMDREVPMLVDQSRVERLNKPGEHTPNHEYLEPPLEAFNTAHFPSQFPGYLFKCFNAGHFPLWPMAGGYRVVQMWRDPRVIKESLDLCTTIPTDDLDWLPDGYMVRMAGSSRMMKNRKDVLSHTDLWFKDVLDDPRGAFEHLKEAGWPITDVDAAVAVVDRGKVRVGEEAAEQDDGLVRV